MKRRMRGICLSAAVLCILAGIVIGICPVEPQLQMKIIYEIELPADTTGRMVIRDAEKEYEFIGRTPEGAYKSYEMTYQLPTDSPIESMEINVQDDTEKSRVRAIEFCNHKLQIKRLAPVQIPDFFECAPGTEYMIDHMYITFISENGAPQIAGTKRLFEELIRIGNNDIRFKINLLFYLLTGYILFILAIRKYVVRKDFREKAESLIAAEQDRSEMMPEYIRRLCCIFLLFVFGLVLWTAVGSQTYGHPDENVSRMAIDYYMGGWLRPDLNSSWTAGTFSEYGASRLTEHTWYYFWAGKFGWIFERLLHVTSYYRMFNVFLLGIMIVMAIRFGKKCPWMYLIAVFTPQLWYLFCYATSDGWDVFWSFMAVFELTWENSALNKYLAAKDKAGKNIAYAALCGLIFSFLLQAKKNYYIVLLLVFFALLFRMLSQQGKEKWVLLKKYIGILFFAFLLIFIKNELDDIMVRAGKENVISGTQIEIPEGETTLYETQLDERGVTLKEVLVDMEFGKILFRSFVGSYGWMQFYGGDRYNNVMRFLYLLLCMEIILPLYKNKNRQVALEGVVVVGLCGFLIAILVYWCWHVDFQPQGRYLMPLVFCVGYLCQRNKGIWKNKAYIGTVACIAVLSMYSFIRHGVCNLLL